ncbi:Panacea domain-containing protein [Phenylobacterium sp.]|uniref:Panacea domain-containing protein n=1 Tax=Phenylobacterium sp. TaxID=1871053 RepID=UPI00271EF17F|nr:type II toxin-antitoxin system antitoxin SocA domain-containing protein [Phenylobacterium sp.]MDO8380378.1 DUF4065 domain-containing protein [Phenylobacterium sp.]
MVAKTSALAVSNFILDRGDDEGIPIRHLKLQKLLYFCYAWFAGNKHEELFSEDIEAWKLGPVVREVYLEFKDCGSRPIHTRAQSYDWDNDRYVEPTIDRDLQSELLPVWNEYKRKTDAWLVEATHADSEPWAMLVRQVGQADKRQIPFSLIERVYSRKVAGIGA